MTKFGEGVYVCVFDIFVNSKLTVEKPRLFSTENCFFNKSLISKANHLIPFLIENLYYVIGGGIYRPQDYDFETVINNLDDTLDGLYRISSKCWIFGDLNTYF